MIATAIFFVSLQIVAVPERWWASPRTLAARRVTAQQADLIERRYQRRLPERCRVSLEVARLTEQIEDALAARVADDTLLRLTEQLARARVREHELRRVLDENR